MHESVCVAGPHTPKVIPEPARAAQPARDEDQPEEEIAVVKKRKREDTPRPAESYSGGKYVLLHKTNKVARK